MPQFAMLFPGQGAQSVGMLAEYVETNAIVAETLAEASSVLGYDLARLIAEGPAEQLNQTEYTQPALVAANVAIWRAWTQQTDARPQFLAGHSLGEYAALVAAGSLDFADALWLTRLRGQAMQNAVQAGVGSMAAIIGLSDDDVREACAEVHQGPEFLVSAANFNAPKQVVIAGHTEAVEKAGAVAKEKGAKLVKPLAVSVPSHCGLMQPAADELNKALSQITINKPQIPVLHNVDGQAKDDADAIRQALIDQLVGSVLWSDSVKKMGESGCEVLLECGPGKVLTGLNKRINRKLKAVALKDPEGLASGLAVVAE